MRELYTVDVMNRYMGARFEDNQPHVYAVADAAYVAMMGAEGEALKSQSILVSEACTPREKRWLWPR